VDEHKETLELKLSDFEWLPNSNIEKITKILAKDDDERCAIIQSSVYHAHRKLRMSSVKCEEFKYTCIHSTPKSGTRYMYSNTNKNGHFGISKVIFGESGITSPVIDLDGQYGMTQGAMAIVCSEIVEAENICKALQSEEFTKVIKSCMFSLFRIDWQLFTYFRKDFWKEFV
ncbi:MAG: hypothetical protein QM487_09910, partial [Candidatus Marithrix sp.]